MGSPFRNPFSHLDVNGEAIIDDRKCHRCAYALRGLKTSDRCPECGTPVRRKIAGGGSMGEAPVEYLDGMRLWSFVALLGGAGMLFLLVVTAVLPPGSAWRVFAALPALAGSVGWAYGVHRVVAPRRLGVPSSIDTVKEWSKLRVMVRVTQWAWVGLAGVVFIGVSVQFGAAQRATGLPPGAAPMPTPSFVISVLPALLTGFLGMIPLYVYLSFLADWANDTALAMRLRTATFMLLLTVPALGLLLFVAALLRPTARFIFIGPGIVIAGVGLVVCIWMSVWPLIQFTNLCRWARRNHLETLDRDARAGHAVRRRVEEALARDEPAMAKQISGRVEVSRRQGSYLAPSMEGEGYDLAPEGRKS